MKTMIIRGAGMNWTVRTLMAVLLLAPVLAAQNQAPDKSNNEEIREVKGADGKTYIEKKTPFGTARYEKRAEKKADEPPANMRAFDDGDTVRFERRTPFGVRKWSKKKTELDDMEKAAIERERRAPARR